MEYIFLKLRPSGWEIVVVVIGYDRRLLSLGWVIVMEIIFSLVRNMTMRIWLFIGQAAKYLHYIGISDSPDCSSSPCKKKVPKVFSGSMDSNY